LVGQDKGFMLYFSLQSQLGYVLWVASKVLKMQSFLCHYPPRKEKKTRKEKKERKENKAHQRYLGKMCICWNKKKEKEKKTRMMKSDGIRGFGIGFIFGNFSCYITSECCWHFKEYVLAGRRWFMFLVFGF